MQGIALSLFLFIEAFKYRRSILFRDACRMVRTIIRHHKNMKIAVFLFLQAVDQVPDHAFFIARANQHRKAALHRSQASTPGVWQNPARVVIIIQTIMGAE